MRHIFALLFLAPIFCHSVIGQESGKTLYLENSEKDFSRAIEPWKRIKVWENDSTSSKGRYVILDDMHIQVGEDTIDVNSLVKVRTSTGVDMVIAAIAGVPLVSGVLGCIVVELLNPNDPLAGVGYLLAAIYTGPAIASVHGFFNGRKRKTENGWVLLIK